MYHMMMRIENVVKLGMYGSDRTFRTLELARKGSYHISTGEQRDGLRGAGHALITYSLVPPSLGILNACISLPVSTTNTVFLE